MAKMLSSMKNDVFKGAKAGMLTRLPSDDHLCEKVELCIFIWGRSGVMTGHGGLKAGSQIFRQRSSKSDDSELEREVRRQRTPFNALPLESLVTGQLTTMPVTSRVNSRLSSAASTCSSDLSSRTNLGSAHRTSTTRQSGL